MTAAEQFLSVLGFVALAGIVIGAAFGRRRR